ncbi:hypothetical protein [Metabacillus sp. cB07]|uniref:hypothetical protein n=1 Tax=Metabacillus sp. cB07 TaxID=2806989 RepID=UPI00193A7BB4|nr:hypothetical protein [Metabacillus sp. cB07]
MIEINLRYKNYNSLSESKVEILKSNIQFLLSNTPLPSTIPLQIIITDNFTKDIHDFQKQYKLQKEGHSENAIGKAFSIKNEKNAVLHFIFLNAVNFDKLLQSEWDDFPLEFNFVHHELGHVYDNQNTFSVIPEAFYKHKELTRIEWFLYEVSSLSWAEFQANFIATRTITKSSLEHYFSELIMVLENLDNRLARAKQEIISDNSNCLEIQFLVKDFFYFGAQVIGLLIGLGINKENEYYNNSWLELGKKYDLESIFILLFDAFEGLQSSYPNWESFHILNPINQCILMLLNNKGISVNEKLIFSIISPTD